MASGKMSISEAHRKLGHLAYGAVTHTISKGYIAGIDLDTNLKPEFCDACAKAKVARQPFLKESKTRAMKYGECVHWDLWSPATMKSINGNLYVAAVIYPYSILNSTLNFHSYFTLRCFQCLPIPYSDVF